MCRCEHGEWMPTFWRFVVLQFATAKEPKPEQPKTSSWPA